MSDEEFSKPAKKRGKKEASDSEDDFKPKKPKGKAKVGGRKQVVTKSKASFTHTVSATVFRIQCSPMVLFTRNLKNIKGVAPKKTAMLTVRVNKP